MLKDELMGDSLACYRFLSAYLIDDDERLLDACVSMYGMDYDTFDHVLYYLYGMETECYIDGVLGE